MSIEERVARARDGDRDALADLIEEHRQLVLAVTRRSGVEPALVDDIFQEAVVVALVSLPSLRRPDRFGPWLCGIARNLARRTGRTTAVHPLGDLDPADGQPATDDLAVAALASGEVRAAIDALPPGQRAAARLYYLDDQPVAEVATRLRIGPSAVKSRLHEARRTLSTVLSTGPSTTPVTERPAKEPAMPTTDTQPAPPEEWVPVTVDALRASDPPSGGDRRTHVVVLADGQGRQLPIWIGGPEAVQLAVGLERHELPRPMTYALTDSLLAAASARIVEIRVTALVEGVFYGTVVIEGADGRREVDARPSDAINLAVVADVPILVAAAVLAEPAAVDRHDWQHYPLSASDVVAETRARMEQQMRRPTEERDG